MLPDRKMCSRNHRLYQKVRQEDSARSQVPIWYFRTPCVAHLQYHLALTIGREARGVLTGIMRFGLPGTFVILEKVRK